MKRNLRPRRVGFELLESRALMATGDPCLPTDPGAAAFFLDPSVRSHVLLTVPAIIAPAGDNAAPARGAVQPRAAPAALILQAEGEGAVIHDVPASIDATGKTEVSTALMQWLSKLPPATRESPATVRFAPGGTYWIDYTIILAKSGTGSIPGVMWRELENFSLDHYRLDLNGATIEQRTTVPYRRGDKVLDARKRWGDPIIATQGATDVQIFGGTLRGSAQTAVYRPAFEEWTGVKISGNPRTKLVEDIVIRDMTIEHVHGDYVYLSSGTSVGSLLKNVRIENNVMRVAGRQGIVLNGGTGVVIKGNTFGETARFLFDSEPTRTQGWSDVTIDGNTGVSGKLGYFQFTGPRAVVAEKLTITNNRLTGGHFLIRLDNRFGAVRDGFTFTDNTAVDGGGRAFGGNRPNFLIGVTRWKNVTITGNSEYFTLVAGKPIHTAVKLTGVENATVTDNTWKNAL